MLRQPGWTRWLPGSVVVNVATLGPLGRLPAPGTWGSAAGMAWFAVVLAPAGTVLALLLSGLLLYLAFALCGEAEKRMGKIDPHEIILDEFACMPLVFLSFTDFIGTRDAWLVGLLGFALFRLLDILKPLGIARLQRFKGGAGVVLDDLAAAAGAWLVLQAVLRFSPLLAWLHGAPAAPGSG